MIPRGPVHFEEWRALVPCFLAALVPALGLAAGCDSGGVECQCQPTGLLLQICPELASQVKSIELSGPACLGAPLLRLDDAGSDAGGSVDYDIQPTEAGACGVEVSFANGLTFAADQGAGEILLVPGQGCCTGLYPNGAREIEACVDAGALDAEVTNDSPSDS